MSEILKVVPEAGQLTYNQRAMQLVMEVPDNDFSEIYQDAVINCTEVMDDEDMAELDCLTLMEVCAETHAQFFAEYILLKILGEEVAEQISEGFCNTEFTFRHLQNILNALDAGSTIDEIIDGDYDEDVDEDEDVDVDEDEDEDEEMDDE